MNPSQASLERAHALRQRARPRSFPRAPEREEPPFPIVLRGYDRRAVDEYVVGLNRMIAELQTARSPQAAVREALDRVGEETSAILQRAHETAEEITSSAQAEARRCLDAAHRDAESLRAEAEQEARTLATDSDTVWSERTALLGDMRKLAENILEVADSAADRIAQSPADAVRAVADAARTEAEAAEAQTSVDADPVDPDAPPPAAGPRLEPMPDDEPRVWRGVGQPTEQMDALAPDEDEDPYGAVDPHYDAGDHHRAESYDRNGPYYS